MMNETALKLKFEITTSMEYFSIEPYVIWSLCISLSINTEFISMLNVEGEMFSLINIYVIIILLFMWITESEHTS